MMKDFGITQDELPAVLKMRDDFKAQYPKHFQKKKKKLNKAMLKVLGI